MKLLRWIHWPYVKQDLCNLSQDATPVTDRQIAGQSLDLSDFHVR